MSILIKGMKKPKSCDECPLVEVPTPHGRLIDADALKKHYEWWKGGTEEHTLDEMVEIFNTIVALQPTIIEAEEGEPNA